MYAPSLPPCAMQAIIKHHRLVGKPIHTVPARVTFFYQFRDKSGKYHKMASVSNTVPVRILTKKPLDKARRKPLK